MTLYSKIQSLIEDGHYEEVLSKLNIDNLSNDMLILKVITLNYMEQYNIAIELCDKIINSSDNNSLRLEAQIHQINAKIGIGKIDPQMIEEIDNLLSNTENNRLKAYLHLLRGELSLSLGEIEEASIDLSMAEFIGRNLNDKLLLSNILNINARLHYTTGDNPKACEYLKNTLKILSSTNNFDRIAKISGNLGILHHAIGNLNEAKSYYDSTLATLEKSFNRSTAVLIYDNLGRYHCAIGEVMRSLEYHFKSLEIAESIDDQIQVGRVLKNIGDCYRHLDKYDFACDYYQRSLENREKRKNIIELGDTYYSLVIIYLYQNKLDLASYYYNLIDEIHSEDMHFIQLKTMSKALILKNKGRRKYITEAEVLLSEIINGKIIDFDFTIDAFRNLSEVLILEYKELRNPEILDELLELLNKMESLNLNINSQTLRTELLLIKSMLKYIDGRIDLSKKILSDAKFIADKFNLKWMKTKIETQEMIYGEDIDLPLGIELYLDFLKEYIVNPFKHIKKAEPQFVLILNQSGLVAFSLNFSDINEFEIELIGSFLSAINSFGKNAFSSKKSLRKINYEEYNIIIKDYSDLLFCYSYKGFDFKAESKLIKFMEYITGEIKLLNILMNNFLVMQYDANLEKTIHGIFIT